jgi:hypothetical protein
MANQGDVWDGPVCAVFDEKNSWTQLWGLSRQKALQDSLLPMSQNWPGLNHQKCIIIWALEKK